MTCFVKSVDEDYYLEIDKFCCSMTELFEDAGRFK